MNISYKTQQAMHKIEDGAYIFDRDTARQLRLLKRTHPHFITLYQTRMRNQDGMVPYLGAKLTPAGKHYLTGYGNNTRGAL